MECDNCGHEVDDADTAPVHRVYVVPETWDQAGSSTTLTDVERWCWSCRTQYPHEEAGSGDKASAAGSGDKASAAGSGDKASAAGSGDTEINQAEESAEAPQ